MKKRHLQRHIDSLARQVESLQAREGRRRKVEDDSFEAAIFDVMPGSDVLVITASGKHVRASVVNVQASTEMIDVGNSFAPGLRSIRIELEPKP